MKGLNKVTLLTASLAVAMAGTTMAATRPAINADEVNNKGVYVNVAIDGTLYTQPAEDIENAIENTLATSNPEWKGLAWSNALEYIAQTRAAEVAVRLPYYSNSRARGGLIYYYQENANGNIYQKYTGDTVVYGAADNVVARPNGEYLKDFVVNDANAARHSEYEIVVTNEGTDIASALTDDRVITILNAIQNKYYEDGAATPDGRAILNIGAAAFAPDDGGSIVVLELNLFDKGEANDPKDYKTVDILKTDFDGANYSTYKPLIGTDGKVAYEKIDANRYEDMYGKNHTEVTKDGKTYVEWTTNMYKPDDTVWADQNQWGQAGDTTQIVTVKRGNIARVDVNKKSGDPDLTVAAKKYYAQMTKGEKLELGATATLKNIVSEHQTGFNTTRKYDITDTATWAFTGLATKNTAKNAVTTAQNGVTTFTVSLGSGNAINSRAGVITVTGYEKAAAPADDSLKNGDLFTATYQDTAVVYKVQDLAKKTAVVYSVANKSAESVVVPAAVEYSDEETTIKFTVTGIRARAFKNMKNLETVSIGKNVTTIGQGAFWRDSNLSTVIFNGSKVTTIAKNAFGKIAKDATFVVKTAAEAELVKDAKTGFVSTMTVEQ